MSTPVGQDPERAAVYCKHGFEGLKKSEDTYASASVLESVKPFARFDAFFEGTDPDDRQYLLLEAASGGHFSDEEKAVHKRGELTEDERPTNEAEDEDEEEEDDDEFFAIAAAAAQVKKPTEVGERAAAATLPRPPPGVGAALLLKASPSVSMSPPGGRLDDPFARVASSFRNSKQEGSQ